MAVLPDPDRAALWADYMREMSATQTGMPLLKADLRAAVNAVDDWAEANFTAFNTAIPQPARGVLTTKQKARLMVYVIQRRWEVSP